MSRPTPSRTVCGIALACALWCGARADTASAQTAPPVPEQLEPRIIGRKGTTTIGLSGLMDRFFSPEELLPGHFVVQVDGARFVTRRIAVRAGLAGTGTFGGETADDRSGAGAPSLHGTGGALYYFTPQSMLSFYLGADYWLQLTRRAEGDSGSLLGTGGLHAALSSRASAFIEASTGAHLRRGSEGERLTRITGRIGLRIRL